jgi:flagellar FliL protein
MPPQSKPEPKEARPESSADAPAPPPVASAGGLKPWLPVVAAVVLAPAMSFAVAEFVLLPRLKKKLQAPEEPVPEKHEEPAKSSEHGGKKGEPTDPASFEFKDVVVNLAGTMGTRYLKTSFVVKGKQVRTVFEADKVRLADATLGVLSAVTLAELEQAGSRNILRGKLVNAYNQTLGKHVVDQVFFTDFVIQ